ncbi:hypothetical protein [Pseudomonas sp. Marseille-QA0892]
MMSLPAVIDAPSVSEHERDGVLDRLNRQLAGLESRLERIEPFTGPSPDSDIAYLRACYTQARRELNQGSI